jgi:hypothetical protein
MNCLGTALYLAGVTRKDRKLHTPITEDCLELLDVTGEPRPGSIVVFRTPHQIYHAGVVAPYSVDFVYHRSGIGGRIEKIPLRDLLGTYTEPIKVEYRVVR